VLYHSLVNKFVKMNVVRLHCIRSLCRQFSASSGMLSYKSAISLENVYPQSSLSLTTPTQVSFQVSIVGHTKHKGEATV
jgi:hypothetical protein